MTRVGEGGGEERERRKSVRSPNELILGTRSEATLWTKNDSADGAGQRRAGEVVTRLSLAQISGTEDRGSEASTRTFRAHGSSPLSFCPGPRGKGGTAGNVFSTSTSQGSHCRRTGPLDALPSDSCLQPFVDGGPHSAPTRCLVIANSCAWAPKGLPS